ncbi:proline-rich protein 19 [Clinocottus analis]|uniref:proline-rich protein 19 n=1 Tax=Clinocottus analis TaxID=304258 RepID=UPI0035C1FBF0
MSSVCGRAVFDKEKMFNVFNKQFKKTDTKLCSVKRLPTDCKCVNHFSKTDGQPKIKRLRSRKERTRMRVGGKEASKSIVRHHPHAQSRMSKDMTYFQNFCPCAKRRNSPIPNVIPAAQEPSIITDSRLIGHHGLFNHEVKSIDIERLLSEHRKLGQSGQRGREKNISTSHPSSTSHLPLLFLTKDVLAAAELLSFENKSANDNCRKKEEKISQGSDITPGQRTQQQIDLSSENLKSMSSNHSCCDAVIIKSKKTNPLMLEKGRELLRTPTVVKENVEAINRKAKGNLIFTVEHTSKNHESPVHQTQSHGLSASPVQLSRSHTDSFDTQHGNEDARCASKSISAVAARLCDCLQFPLLRRRDLVAESREVLLKALRDRHGPRLQENLLEVQRGLSFGVKPTTKIQEQKPPLIDELFPPGAIGFQSYTASQPCLDTQKTTCFKMMGSSPFNWKFRPQPHQNLEQTAEWATRPMETSVSLVDDILRPAYTPESCMDFEPFGGATSDHLFSPTLCWGEKFSVSQHWKDRFNKPKNNTAGMFDPFEKSFLNHTRAVPERSSGSQYRSSNIQPFVPYPTLLPDRRAAPMHFPQEKDPFETDEYSFAPSFSVQMHHPLQSFQPLSQVSHPSTCPPLMSHHTDMIHYPPSHTLERDLAAPLSSFPSPEHWSFPPMRLY